MSVVVKAFIDDVIKCVNVSLNEKSGMFRPFHNVSLMMRPLDSTFLGRYEHALDVAF